MRGFGGRRSFFNLNHKPRQWATFYHNQLLQEKPGLVDRKCIPVAPLPNSLLKMYEKSDFAKLCSEEQLGGTYTQYIFSVNRKRK
jgi:hypothetical protein